MMMLVQTICQYRNQKCQENNKNIKPFFLIVR